MRGGSSEDDFDDKNVPRNPSLGHTTGKALHDFHQPTNKRHHAFTFILRTVSLRAGARILRRLCLHSDKSQKLYNVVLRGVCI